MKKTLYYLSLSMLLLLAQSCYDDYKFDYSYTSTYFSRQYPLRSIIVEDEKDLTFKVGVVLSGKYSNETNEKVSYEIAPDLLDEHLADYPNLKLLPSDYYTMSDEGEFTIAKGKVTGTSVVTLNKELFLNDPLAIAPTYALPLRLIESSTDSIKYDKDFQIVVIRYYNQYHGSYWLRGTDYTLDATGAYADTTTYNNQDLVSNRDLTLNTYAKNDVLTSYIGANSTSNEATFSMKINVAEDGLCALEGVETSNISGVIGSGTYNKRSRDFALVYYYDDAAGARHQVFDTLYYRNTELYVDSWMEQ